MTDRGAPIVIRDVSPGRPGGSPAKGLLGEPTEVGATIFRDGHGIVRAQARLRRVAPDPGADVVTELRAQMDDRFTAEVLPDSIGRYEWVVEAWTDRYATWCRDLRAWDAADEDVEPEFAVGAQILDDLIEAAPPALTDRLVDASSALRSLSCSTLVRLGAALDDAVLAIAAVCVDPTDHTVSPTRSLRVERPRAAAGAWYECFPRSEGGFARGVSERLEAISAMGFDVVYFPPIHPIGRTNRKGRHNALAANDSDPGSPWAIGSADGGHTSIEPGLGTLEDFDRCVATATRLGLEVALDYALQCAPDHPWLAEHPEWFRHRPDGSIRYAENPPKRYQDIHPLDFWCPEPHRTELWSACRDILEFWIERGVRIFRVDNPHTKPFAFWDWLVNGVLDRHPDVVFLAEAFTRPAVMSELAELGFSQSYTYFTWRVTAADVRSYVEELTWGPGAGTFRPNFWPSTPDILFGPLRGGSPGVFRVRALLAALLSPSYGVISGYELCESRPASPLNEEYHDSEKYRIVTRNWDQPGSLAPFLTTLNRIRHDHPAFLRLDTIRFAPTDHAEVVAWTRHDPTGRPPVLVVVNNTPDTTAETAVHVDAASLGLPAQYRATDELTGESWTWHDGANYIRFDPQIREAHVLVLMPLPEDHRP